MTLIQRRIRTIFLAVGACVALFWGAVDLVGVPVQNLFSALADITAGLILLVLLALPTAALLSWLRRRR